MGVDGGNMDTGVFTAVLVANLMTAMCIYGFIQITRDERSGNFPSWLGIGCALFPLIVGAAGFISSGYLPPYLDAVAAQ